MFDIRKTRKTNRLIALRSWITKCISTKYGQELINEFDTYNSLRTLSEVQLTALLKLIRATYHVAYKEASEVSKINITANKLAGEHLDQIQAEIKKDLVILKV